MTTEEQPPEPATVEMGEPPRKYEEPYEKPHESADLPEPEPYEPPPSRRYDPARWLRTLAGVDEKLLRQVWFERARHTALGGIILGTGLIAGFSMWVAINESLGFTSVFTVIPALIWLVFIVSLDRVLVSTMVGAGRRWGSFLMRLALAIMFGFIIAEPLTIRIFQTAIEQHIQDERTQQLDTLRSTLLACNTKEVVTGTTPEPAGCEHFRLSFDQSPTGIEKELATRRQAEAALAAGIASDSAEDARLTDLARKECAGTSGPGLTGQRGYGPDCLDRNRDVTNFRSTHPIKDNIDKLAAVRADIASLEGQLSQSQAAFEQTRNSLIAQRVQEARDHQGHIGFLERMDALHSLAASSTALFLATWAVRLLFVLVDCLPVVVKFSGGLSEYDKVFRAQSANAVERYGQDLDLLRERSETRLRKRKAEYQVELQEHRASVNVRRGNAVSRVSTHLLGSRRVSKP
jgi:hypothetical protein